MIFILSLSLLGSFTAAESYEASRFQRLEHQRTDGDLCLIWGHRVALLGKQLFFIHRNYTFVPEEEATPQPYLYVLDLNDNMPVEAYIPLNAFQKYSLPSNAVPAIAYEDQDTQTILRYNNDSLFTYFDTGTGAPATFMSLFNTNTNSWSPANVQGEGVDLFQYWGSEASVSLPEIGLSFSFGGNPIFPAPEAHPGLVTFNASTPSWSNYTAVPAGSSGVQPPLVAESEIVYVPYGKAGVLLMMGGYSIGEGGHSFNVPFSQISVYDIASGSWFVVTATGDIPPGRRQFCVVVSAAPDLSSFQVTIHGGYDAAVTYFEDVYVLTVPAFHWINIATANDNEISVAINIGRAHHRRVTYNDAQMILLGGTIRIGAPVPVNESACRTEYPPIRVLDTTTYTWKTSFNDSLKYTVSSAVTAFIGGDGDGNAKVTGPQSDFNFTALNTIFSEAIGAAKNNSSPTQTPSSTSKSNTGTIAGGVVAGVAGLAILAGIAYFFFRRKKRVDEFKERSNGWENSAPPAEYKSPMVNESSEGAELPGHQMYSRPVEVDGRGLCEMRPPFEMTG